MIPPQHTVTPAGLYAAAHQSYRFAAADTASEAYRPKVVSWVLAGGVFAGVLVGGGS